VIGAAVPVTYGAFVEGLPNPIQVVGFGFALVGIWFAARSPSAEAEVYRQGLVLAVAAGLSFGGFFVAIAQVEEGAVFAPLVVTKMAAICVGLAAVWASGLRLPSIKANAAGLLAGGLDTGANVLFLLARQFTRLDAAAVLASLYPAVTVLLARVVLKERINPAQSLGAVLCLVAIALIAI
jgi:drug/metabolite transporter (DMT)-like permease